MIVIISSKFDTSTDEVIEWLCYYNVKFRRFNFEEITNLENFYLTNNDVDFQLGNINISDISVIWHRRARLNMLPQSIRKSGKITEYLQKEEDSLVKSIEYFLSEFTGQYIGSFHKEVENFKINNLLIAKKNGLDIPETLITTDKKSLMHFFNLYPSIITKDLRYPLSVEYGDYKLLSDGTFRVTLDMINNLNDTFSPTLVQNEINKEYEIRIFFFMKKLFTMAIFSQSDTQTEVDYRNYNSEKPNRNVPVVLPKEIEIKILKFVTELKLKTGSIDLIYSKCGKYYFLEINPMGQFDWVSKNCNYNIEKKIAQHLVKIENEN